MAGGFQLRIVTQKSSPEWVVMLPGAGATSAVWFPQIKPFSRRFNIALIDLPGHRRREGGLGSSKAGYSFQSLIPDLDRTVSDAGIASCHVVALSFGTILARAWAVRYPARVRSMVLAGTIADLRPVARVLLNAGWYLRPAMPYMALYRLYAWIIMPGWNHRSTRTLFYRDAKRLGRAEFNRWFDIADEVLALFQVLRSSPAATPVLHVLGSQDYMFLHKARSLAGVQLSEIVILDGVGHVCSIEGAERFNSIALAFLARHASALCLQDSRSPYQASQAKRRDPGGLIRR